MDKWTNGQMDTHTTKEPATNFWHLLAIIKDCKIMSNKILFLEEFIFLHLALSIYELYQQTCEVQLPVLLSEGFSAANCTVQSWLGHKASSRPLLSDPQLGPLARARAATAGGLVEPTFTLPSSESKEILVLMASDHLSKLGSWTVEF